MQLPFKFTSISNETSLLIIAGINPCLSNTQNSSRGSLNWKNILWYVALIRREINLNVYLICCLISWNIGNIARVCIEMNSASVSYKLP